jgi:hypothetical protein
LLLAMVAVAGVWGWAIRAGGWSGQHVQVQGNESERNGVHRRSGAKSER